MLERDGGWGAAVTIPIDRTRVAFAVPWAGRLLVGTTDTAFEGDARTIEPTEAEERQILAEAGLALEAGALGPVCARFAGVRVLPAGTVATARAQRETMLSSGPLGMVSVAGGKLTTYRRIALAVLHQLRAELELHRIDRRPRPLPGAADPDVAADALRRRHPELEPALAAHLAAHLRHARRGGDRGRPARAARRRRPRGGGAGAVRADARVGGERGGRPPAAHDALGHGTGLGRGARPGRGAARAVILAIDQGTTGTTCLVVDGELRVRGRGYREFPQHFPQPGWVEHDPEEIWSYRASTPPRRPCARPASARPSSRRSGSRTSARRRVLWERATGRPVAPRDRLAGPAHRRALPRRCPPSCCAPAPGSSRIPYFSATKLEWLLARTELPSAELAFGTVDSWLVWKLTGGRVHATDLTNASRTMLLDLDTLDWDAELLDLFGVDPALLPRLVRSSEVVGEADLLGATLPIAGIAGDQQAALFGHGCFERGEAKATYGTGSFVLVNAGAERGPAPPGLLETVAASGGYALEGAILASGAAIQWLRDGLGDPRRRGRERAAGALGRVDRRRLVRPGVRRPRLAALERGGARADQRHHARHDAARRSSAPRSRESRSRSPTSSTLPGGVEVLRADGGATANGFLMQFQADLLGCPVEVAAERETTALGAAALAGRAVGLWPDDDAIRRALRRGRGLRAVGRPGLGRRPPRRVALGTRARAALTVTLDGAEQRGDVDGLRYVPVEARRQEPLVVSVHGLCGDGEHGYRGRAGVGPQPAEGLDAVRVGQADVHQDETGTVLDGQLDRFGGGGRLERAVPLRPEEVAEELHVLLVVLDDEDGPGRHD